MIHTRHLVLLDNPRCIRELMVTDGILSINAFSVDYLGNPITLGLQPGADGTFTLIFQYVNDMPLGSVLYLHDMRDDVWQNLMMDSTYTHLIHVAN